MSKILTAEEFFNSKLTYNYEWTSSVEEMQSKICNTMIKFAIEQLKQIESHYKGSAFGMVQSKIQELEQQIKQLENK